MNRVVIKKNLLKGISAVVLTLMLISSYGITSRACEVPVIVTAQSATPRSAIIDWRYKGVNGRLYRRQYNYTEQCWIGEWELVP